MEISWILSFLLLIISLTIFLKLFKKQKTPTNLPPGPPKLPLIGNLHQLASKNTLPHRRLAELAAVYGPIMHLKLGEVSTVVISSPGMAREALKTHDAVLCDRPKLLMPQVVFYKSTDIALAPYGEYWRQVRKIATLELFTARRVQGFRCFREDGVMDFIKSLLPEAEAGSVINLTSKIFALSFDITLRLALNKKADDGEEFRKLVADMAALLSGFSIGDLYPSIEFISVVSGMKRKLQDIVKRVDKIMDPIIEEHLCNKRLGQNEGDEDIVDILLQFHNDNLQHHTNEFSLTTDNIKAIIIEVFSAGGETSSTTIDWAMSELLKNPRVMEKAQNEVRRVFQGKKIMIDEASLDKLVYMKLVIKETLRLHPPVPFLVPRESMERCEINGYEIPPNTRVFVNAWAIGRDPEYWQDPEVFSPERFEDSPINYRGTYYELIPFGAGRRMCPGMGLGLATVELVLAMLLYHFDWKLPHGERPQGLNMDETFGIVGRRKNDLELIPVLYSLGFK
ncbi:cytochrome P450 71D8-like [Chenopodium quinoa]|uniref:cytochrome P450 71D8-like n=1 Tax=Chenopodium quinoa TaxID=63459 RepID=UPI000B772D83|nr:cytochrome P450 71D8-like [Chenopodium quinoa]